MNTNYKDHKNQLQWNLNVTKGQGTGKSVRCNEVLFHIFTITGVKKIIFFVTPRTLLYGG